MLAPPYERYPLWIVLIANALGLFIYTLGALIFASLAWWAAIPYLAFCLWIEFRILKKSCTNCCYYGQRCGLGKGALCSLFFKRGDPQTFASRTICWRDIAPDLLTGLAPLTAGIVLLVLRFSWPLLAALAGLLLLMTFGNGIVRGSLLCNRCKQRDLGCPAQKFFAGVGK